MQVYNLYMKSFVPWGVSLLFLVLAFFVHAQAIPQPLALNADPPSPSPREKVSISASTPTTDKNSVTFLWTINGVRRDDLSGVGKSSFTLMAGTVGSFIKVGVTALYPGSGQVKASLSIPVADLSLTWFAETYVPSWYKGKALPVENSVVSLVAVPNVVVGGLLIAPENLIYRWALDDEDKALDGVGQQVFRIQTSDLPGTSHHVKVTVRDVNRAIIKTGEIFIVSTKPTVVIHKLKPLGGVEPRSVISEVKSRSTEDFTAEPFFFPITSKKQLSFQWDVLGTTQTQEVTQNPWILTVNSGDTSNQIIPVTVTVGQASKSLSASQFISFSIR